MTSTAEQLSKASSNQADDKLEKGDADVTKEEVQSEMVDDFPEGGWKAWSAVLGAWIVQFCTFGYVNAYGVYNDFYVREYLSDRYTSSQISWIGSTQLLLTLSFGLVSGRAFDGGYFYHLMISGAVLLVFCLFMLSLSHPGQYYQVFLAQGLGVGIAIGITYVPSFGLVSQYFRRRRATTMGIAASGAGVGGALHPIMLNRLFHSGTGFHDGVRASAGFLAGLMLIAILLMRPRLGLHKKNPNKVFSVLGDIPYVIMIIGTVLVLTGLYFPIFFLQLNAIKNGLSPHFAFYTLVILNGSSVVGRVFPNMLVSRVGVFNVVIPCVTTCGILIFCTLAVKNVVGTVIYAILYGFFSGAYVGLLPPMVGSLARNDAEIGVRMGVCFTFTGFGGLVGSPIAGALLSSSFVWWRPSIFAGLSVLCGVGCFTTTRMLVSRKKGSGWL